MFRVTEQELAAILKQERWTLQSSVMAGGKKAYAGKQRQQGKLATRYIGTETGLQEMVEADVLEKLRRPPKSR
jgi:hypothetical protein